MTTGQTASYLLPSAYCKCRIHVRKKETQKLSRKMKNLDNGKSWN